MKRFWRMLWTRFVRGFREGSSRYFAPLMGWHAMKAFWNGKVPVYLTLTAQDSRLLERLSEERGITSSQLVHSLIHQEIDRSKQSAPALPC